VDIANPFFGGFGYLERDLAWRPHGAAAFLGAHALAAGKRFAIPRPVHVGIKSSGKLTNFHKE